VAESLATTSPQACRNNAGRYRCLPCWQVRPVGWIEKARKPVLVPPSCDVEYLLSSLTVRWTTLSIEHCVDLNIRLGERVEAYAIGGIHIMGAISTGQPDQLLYLDLASGGCAAWLALRCAAAIEDGGWKILNGATVQHLSSLPNGPNPARSITLYAHCCCGRYSSPR
jgi:hypothetical protein